MSHPFERILLATEHTDFDSGAERIAFELASHCDVPLAAVVPVVSNPEYEAIAPQIAAQVEQEAARHIDSLSHAARNAGLMIEVVARRGEEPYREIVQEAEARHTDLIVLRRRGKRSFLSNLMVGEMVSKVVAHAPCSVLFVPRTARMWSRSVLAAIDTSPNAAHVVHTAARVAKQCSLPLHIIQVLPHDMPDARSLAESTLAHALAVASSAGVEARHVLTPGKAYEQILATSKRLDTDLIVIGRHGETNLLRTPFGGTTHKVIGLAECPVLVVSSRDEGG